MPMVRSWHYITYSCWRAPCCTRVHLLNSTATAGPVQNVCWVVEQYAGKSKSRVCCAVCKMLPLLLLHFKFKCFLLFHHVGSIHWTLSVGTCLNSWQWSLSTHFSFVAKKPALLMTLWTSPPNGNLQPTVTRLLSANPYKTVLHMCFAASKGCHSCPLAPPIDEPSHLTQFANGNVDLIPGDAVCTMLVCQFFSCRFGD